MKQGTEGRLGGFTHGGAFGLACRHSLMLGRTLPSFFQGRSGSIGYGLYKEQWMKKLTPELRRETWKMR